MKYSMELWPPVLNFSSFVVITNCLIGASSSSLSSLESPIPLFLSPNPDHSASLQTKERCQKPSSAFFVTIATSSSDVSSCQVPAYVLSFWLDLGTNPACGRYIITPCLHSIKSPCFSSGHNFSDLIPGGERTDPEVALLNIPVVILFQLAWSGLLYQWRNLLCGGGVGNRKPF